LFSSGYLHQLLSSFATLLNKKMTDNKQSLSSWVILISLVLVWGSSFILIKKSLLYFSSTEVGIMRVVITFLFLFPVGLQKALKTDWKMAINLAISGIIGSLVPALLFAKAQTGIDSSLAGTLNALTPLFTLLMGVSFFKMKTRWYNVIGVFIGLIGAIGLIYVNGNKGFVVNISYSALIIIATVCYAFNVNFIKVKMKSINSLTITVLTFFYIGIPCLIFVLFFSEIPHKLISNTENLKGLGYLSILSIVGTGLALIAFNKLIKVSSPIFASSVTYLIPIVAIIWGIIDGEAFKFSYMLWFILIIFGILLVNASPSRGMNVGSRLLIFRRHKI
jgi:drug/metabolite transporter (DMT)-like permease